MRLDKDKFKILFISIFGASITWMLNHHMGLGPVVSNGLVGVMAAILMPASLAGVLYTSSFVGMSSITVLPSIYFALLGGALAGVGIAATTEVYAGIGGKGGTTAAAASIVTKAISGLIG